MPVEGAAVDEAGAIKVFVGSRFRIQGLPGGQCPGPAQFAAAPVDRTGDDRVAAGECAGGELQVARGESAVEAGTAADAIDAGAVELRPGVEGRAATGEIDGPSGRVDDAGVVGEIDAAADRGRA